MIRAALLFTALAAPAHAQSFDEAVRQNVALAVSICARHVGDPPQALSALTTAGFAFLGTEGPANDETYIYEAPAGTATIRVYYGQMAPDCQVETRHLGPAETGAIVGGVLQGVLPGKFAPRPAECPVWSEIGRQIPFEVGVSDRGNGGGCAEGDGARISFFFAV